MEATSLENLLMRGCKLKNTKWTLGMVVYTGHESKVMMNMTEVLHLHSLVFFHALVAGTLQSQQHRATPECADWLNFWFALSLLLYRCRRCWSGGAKD